MKPIVVSYPRTGSKIITDIVYNYSRQYFKSEGCLQEFLLTGWYRQDNFRFENNKILGEYTNLPKNLWTTSSQKKTADETLKERISWLSQNPNYVFKLMVNPRVPELVYNYCLNNFDCIFLERKDNLRSFLSFLFLSETKHHYEIGSLALKKENTKIQFHENLANTWIWDYNKFQKLKDNCKSIVYEDLLINGNISEDLTLQHLGWNVDSNFVPLQYSTIATPYEDNLLEYFVNPNQVIDYIKRYNDIFKSTMF
jgi:hypothetical protein